MNNRVYPAVAYGLLILALSSIPGESMPPLSWLSLNKLIHVGEYAIFAIILVRVFSGQYRGLLKAGLAALLVATLYGAFDESYQMLIPGRDSSLWDWLADLLGAVIGISAYTTWQRFNDPHPVR